MTDLINDDDAPSEEERLKTLEDLEVAREEEIIERTMTPRPRDLRALTGGKVLTGGMLGKKPCAGACETTAQAVYEAGLSPQTMEKLKTEVKAKEAAALSTFNKVLAVKILDLIYSNAHYMMRDNDFVASVEEICISVFKESDGTPTSPTAS